MKKKILNLLISGFMIFSSWTVLVFAEEGAETLETDEISIIQEEESSTVDLSDENIETSVEDEERTEITEIFDEKDNFEESIESNEMEEVIQNQDDTIISSEEENSIPNFVSEGIIYVSAHQTENQAPKGSAENPYPSLKEAVDVINSQEEMDVTIELMSDLTLTSCVRINGKNVTIHGNGYTITRGETFDLISDLARSWYNPAMIEVCNSANSATASLYLENVTLDDKGLVAGTCYSQASTNGTGNNGDKVQDAIIATYDGVGTIILGDKTVLTGYAGMSAVRMSGGTLIMEKGSTITGGKVFTTKGGGTGPAGAVWIQGGNVVIEEGASIEQIQGRALYLDGKGSLAVVNGNISHVIPNSNMWNGDGTAMHIRNHAAVILGETGRIHHINGGNAVIYVTSGSFEAQKGSVISNTSNTRLMNLWNSKVEDTESHRIYLDGEITNCSYGDVLFYAFVARYEIGPNADICNTTASNRSVGMFYLQNGGEMTIQGNIHHNNNTVVYMGNQGGGGTIVRVKEGAYLHNNEGSYVIYANNSGYVIMEGGEISENKTAFYIRSKDNWPGSRLEMSGGKIINNSSYGVWYSTCGKEGPSYVNITGGEIYGNGSSYSPYQLYISGSNAKDAISRIYVKEGVIKESEDKLDNINTAFGTLSSIKQQGDLYLGNAKKEASSYMNELIKTYKANDKDLNDYTTKGSALWFKAEADHLSFSVNRSYSLNKNLPLYIAYLPLNEEGTPISDSQLMIKEVVNDAQIEIQLEQLEPQKSYALMWVQPTEKFGSLEIMGDPEIYEELGVHHYKVNYHVSYSLSKDILSLLQSGHEFTIDVQLDDRLTYNSDENVMLPEKSVFEIVSIDYNEDTHKLTTTLKLKEGFNAYSKADMSFQAYTDLGEVVETTFVSDATISSSLVLSGGVQSTDFTLKTVRPATTHLIPLPLYSIDYTGGRVFVKEGTAFSYDTEGGVMTSEYPENIINDTILSDPSKDGFVFAGWKIVHEETAIFFTACYREIFTVTFVDYDDQILDSVEVEAGSDAVAPQVPSRDHFRFIGWDTLFTNVQSDLTVKALYQQLFTVTFVDYDDTVLNCQQVEAGEKADVPEDPIREGYNFIGWDLSFENVQSDLTIKALYEKIEVPVVSLNPEVPQTPVQSIPPSMWIPEIPEIEIPDPVPPLVSPTPELNPEPEVVEIPESVTPLASPEGNWALVNLIAVVVSVLFGIFTVLNKKDNNQEQEKKGVVLKGSGAISAIVAVVTFAFTEKLSLPMAMIDNWTILMIFLAVMNIVIFGIRYNTKNKDQISQE